jgi:hypothetical protein
MAEITLIFIITIFIVGTYWVIDSDTTRNRLFVELVQKMSLRTCMHALSVELSQEISSSCLYRTSSPTVLCSSSGPKIISPPVFSPVSCSAYSTLKKRLLLSADYAVLYPRRQCCENLHSEDVDGGCH